MKKHILCQSVELKEGGCKSVLTSAGIKGFVVRKSGEVYGYVNNCPHRDLPLEWQPEQFLDDASELIVCANHGALFDITTGRCVSGPCVGEFLQAISLCELDGTVVELSIPKE